MIWFLVHLQWRAEAAGCPGPTRFLDALENIVYSSRKIYDNHFYLVTYQNLSVFTLHENSLLGCPPVLHHVPVTTFFSSFLVIYLHSLRKLAPWMPPRVDARGRRTVRTPSARHCPLEWVYSVQDQKKLGNILLCLYNCLFLHFTIFGVNDGNL